MTDESYGYGDGEDIPFGEGFDMSTLPPPLPTGRQIAEEMAREPFSLDVYTAAELTALPDPPESDYLLGPFVVRSARTIVVGDTGHGKTTLVRRHRDDRLRRDQGEAIDAERAGGTGGATGAAVLTGGRNPVTPCVRGVRPRARRGLPPLPR